MQNLFEKLNLVPFGATPSERQLMHLKDFNKKAFFHFGVNTFTNREWGEGNETEKDFNPTETDVRQWIKVIKAAGFTLAILTAKHHDGFCLWPSKYTEHTIAGSPYKNGEGDLVREFTDACHEFGINCGIYLSPWDRHSPYWGTNEYSKFYNEQIKELMTGYGRIDEVWWDGAGSNETPYDWGLWAHTVRNYQPNAVIFGSLGATEYVECRWVGNEGGFAGNPHYPTINAESLRVENTAELNSGIFGGDRFIPAEVDVSIRPGWFYHADQDDKVKTVRQLVDLWFNSVGRSAMMLLNFPPDRRGLVKDIDAFNAIKANEIIKKTFAVNLAAGGSAKANSVRDIICEPDFILNDYYESFYAASDDNINPTLEIALPCETEFDTFVIGEKIELGVRVKGYRVEAYKDGNWVVLADRKSIGYLWAEKFERIKTDRVRIVIYDAAAAPVIRTFGLYKMPDEYYNAINAEKAKMKNAQDLTKLSTAKIINEGKAVKVEFGGIYPFNTVCFNGSKTGGSYEIHVFDGLSYKLAYKGVRPEEKEVVRLPETVSYSYQMKLVTNKDIKEDIEIEIYELD